MVLMDVATGRLLVYASHVEQGPARDLCAEATAPSASVFKIVTAAALVEDAHLGPDTKQCYCGGEQRITSADLVDDPQRDRWCTTLARRDGPQHQHGLRAPREGAPRAAAARGDGAALRLRRDRSPSTCRCSRARSTCRASRWSSRAPRRASGTRRCRRSQAAEMSAIVARGGEASGRAIVGASRSPSGARRSGRRRRRATTRRVVARETAEQLATMMEHTVSEGTSWRAFHDGRGPRSSRASRSPARPAR